MAILVGSPETCFRIGSFNDKRFAEILSLFFLYLLGYYYYYYYFNPFSFSPQGLDRTTLTRNLSVLERQGFIKISSGKDHRTRIVTATQKGRSAVAKALPLWNEVQGKVKQQMGENSWRELMQNLGHFVTVADQLMQTRFDK
jgi:DNA-binding HxlR family transcriptional regulator